MFYSAVHIRSYREYDKIKLNHNQQFNFTKQQFQFLKKLPLTQLTVCQFNQKFDATN